MPTAGSSPLDGARSKLFQHMNAVSPADPSLPRVALSQLSMWDAGMAQRKQTASKRGKATSLQGGNNILPTWLVLARFASLACLPAEGSDALCSALEVLEGSSTRSCSSSLFDGPRSSSGSSATTSVSGDGR